MMSISVPVLPWKFSGSDRRMELMTKWATVDIDTLYAIPSYYYTVPLVCMKSNLET